MKTTAQLGEMADKHCKKAMRGGAKFGETGMPTEVNVVMYAFMLCEVHESFGRWLDEFAGQMGEVAAEGEDEDEHDIYATAEGLFDIWQEEQFGFDEKSMRAGIMGALNGNAKQLVELTTELGALEI